MKKAAFCTLGCKVNQYETQAMLEMFKKEGYEIVDFAEKADVYIINTCAVTALSEKKSRQMIRRARKNNQHSIVVVTGCYSQLSPKEIEDIPGVKLIIGTRDKSRITEYVKQMNNNGEAATNIVGDVMTDIGFEPLVISSYNERTRAYLKIQDGCNQYCSYCIIPYVRGRARSRNPSEVLNEAVRLGNAGFKEVVLTGVHIASYGAEFGMTLSEIIKEIHKINSIGRIRLSSIEPGTVTAEFLETVNQLEKVCPYFHVSMQSGCDETLRRMNRKYRTKEYRESIELLRESIEDAAIGTDVIVGFPGETDLEFEQTYRFIEEMRFSRLHVFKFSPRKGTVASELKNQVSSYKKDERSESLISLSNESMFRFNKSYEGRVLPVLFEQETQDGRMEGLTPNYIRVVADGDADLKGKICNVMLKEAEEDYVRGAIQCGCNDKGLL